MIMKHPLKHTFVGARMAYACLFKRSANQIASFRPWHLNMADQTEGECDGNVAKKGKKRVRREEKHKRNVTKRLRNTGQAYVTTAGREAPSKRDNRPLHNQQCCKAKFCNYKTMSEEDKDSIRIAFLDIGDYDKQNSFLRGLVSGFASKKGDLRKRRVPDQTRRHKSYTYHTRNMEGKAIRVCQHAFMDVYALTERRLRTIRGMCHVMSLA